jgi:hypothetical protein
MFRPRIQAGFISLVMLSAGCGTAPPSPPVDVTPLGPSPAPALPSDEESAREELCDPQRDASIANVVNELENFDETDDVRDLSDALERIRANLSLITLGPDGISLRDSAVGLLVDLQAGIDDPTTRSTTALAAAQTLRGLGSQVCPPPEM